MMHIEYLIATGRIVRVSAETIAPGEETAVIVAPAADPERVWVTGAPPALAPRPAAPALPETAVGGLSLIGLPEGTAVEIVGPLNVTPEIATATAGVEGAVTVTITASGLYQVTVTPPWPAQRVRARVPVTAGDPPSPAAVHVDMPAPMMSLQALAIARIDAASDALARLIVTPGAAMPMIYLRKAEEAAAVLALPVPDDADAATYPMVAAEAAVDGVGMQAAATTIATRAAIFAAVGGIWDRLRLEAKRDVRAATTPAEIAAAEARVTRAEFEARLLAAGITPSAVLDG